MTQLEVLVAIANRVRTVSGSNELSPGGYRFYRDPSITKNPPTAGFVTMSSFWQPERQISRGGPTALYHQTFNVTFSVYVPKNLGLGTAMAEAELIAALLRGLYVDEVEFLGLGSNHIDEHEIESHTRVDLTVRCDKTSYFSVATAGYLIFDEGGRLLLE